MSYQFLPKDLEALELLIASYETRLKQVEAQMGEAAEVGGNVWHDNFAFEQSQRDAGMYRRKLSELNAVRDSAVVVEPSTDTNEIMIGTYVTIEDLASQAVTKYFVCGYKVFDPNLANSDTADSSEVVSISYLAPMGAILIGRKTGEIVSARIGKHDVSFRITELSKG